MENVYTPCPWDSKASYNFEAYADAARKIVEAHPELRALEDALWKTDTSTINGMIDGLIDLHCLRQGTEKFREDIEPQRFEPIKFDDIP